MATKTTPESVHKVTTVWPVLALLSERAYGPWIPLPRFAHDDLSALDKRVLDSREAPDYDRFTIIQPRYHTYQDDYSNFGSSSNLGRSMHHFTQLPGHTRLEAVGFLNSVRGEVFERVVIRIRRITVLYETDEMLESTTDLTLNSWVKEGLHCSQMSTHRDAYRWWRSLDRQIWQQDFHTHIQVMSRVEHQMPQLANIRWGPLTSDGQRYLESDAVKTLTKAPEENTCGICMVDLVEDTPNMGRAVGLSCHEKHVFHESCILKWFDTPQTRCPFCRTTLYETIDIYSCDRRELNAEAIREVTGLTMVLSELWTLEMSKYAIQQ